MNIFNSIPLWKPKRHNFNLGFENKLTTDFFRLTPFMCKEALPDDVWRIRPEIFARVAPMLAPVYHRFNIRAYFFFVPNRLIWDDFEKWINPKSGSSDIVAPRFSFSLAGFGNLAPKSLADYLGVNFGLAPEDQATYNRFFDTVTNMFGNEEFEVSALPFRAYQKIYNDWFIDLNNMSEVDFGSGSGVTDVQNLDLSYDSPFKLRYRAWEHDYLTSAMPDAQRGPEVYAFDGVSGSDLTIEGAGNVDVSSLSLPSQDVVAVGIRLRNSDTVLHTVDEIVSHYADFGFNSAQDFLVNNPQITSFGQGHYAFTQEVYSHLLTDPVSLVDGTPLSIEIMTIEGAVAGTMSYDLVLQTPGGDISGDPLFTIPASSIASKLSVSSSSRAAAVTVEELRTRMQMQSFLERNEVGGSRYTEMLYAHWGVKSRDGRLQRSEFIGGCKQPIMINDVSQTSAPTDDDPLGQWAGQGVSSSAGRTIKYHVPEHGFIIGVLCVMPRTGYFQGLHKMWKRFDRLDYYFPSFSHLGEQEVKNYEVLNSAYDPDETFGYQSRYAEYKTSLDEVHGDFKGNLSFYHGARAFATPASADDIPKLSDYFTVPQNESSDDIDRIFPVLNSENPWFNADHFMLDIYNHIQVSRRMPKFVTPANGYNV